jgi:hypothetical protein
MAEVKASEPLLQKTVSAFRIAALINLPSALGNLEVRQSSTHFVGSRNACRFGSCEMGYLSNSSELSIITPSRGDRKCLSLLRL